VSRTALLPGRVLWWLVAAGLGFGLGFGLVACSSGGTSTNGATSHVTTEELEALLPPVDGPRPTVVLVHGAWADASSWNGVTASLLADGYAVRAIANPVEDLTTDAEYVADFLDSLTGPIVLVGHSYGGAVITNAAAGDRQVKTLVYVDAAAPDVGETNGSLSGADSVLSHTPDAQLFDQLPSPGAGPGAADLYLRKDIFIQSFANDLPRDVAARLWASQRSASTEAFDTPSRHAAWKTIPSWYFVSTGDRIITPASEMSMAKRAHSRVTMFQGGSHLTLISHPEAVANVIRAAIGSLR
jgi:pimeloyl-ACP methyl ester carboxylesterase